MNKDVGTVVEVREHIKTLEKQKIQLENDLLSHKKKLEKAEKSLLSQVGANISRKVYQYDDSIVVIVEHEKGVSVVEVESQS